MVTQREWLLRLSSLVGEKTLFNSASYRRFWLSEQFGSTAFAALLYTLFLVISRDTGVFFSSLFAAIYIGPAAVLVTVSGALTDRLPKRTVLIAAYLAWAILAAGFAIFIHTLWAIYLLAVLFAIVSQVKGAAGSSARPLLVPREKLDRATSLGQLGGLISQFIGVLILPFIFLRTVGAGALAVMCIPLFLAAAYEVARIKKLGGRIGSVRRVVSGSRAHFSQAWAHLQSDQVTYMMVWLYVLTSIISYVVITLVPTYASSVLNVRQELAVFILLPGAAGIWLALRVNHVVLSRVRPLPAVVFAFAGLVAGVMALGFVQWFSDALVALGAPAGVQALQVLIVVALAMVIGFSYMFLNVADNAVINARIPPEMQGRVFSGQNVLSNVASVAPILLAGVSAKIAGVPPVFVATAAICGGIGILVLARHGVDVMLLTRTRVGAPEGTPAFQDRPVSSPDAVGEAVHRPHEA